MRKHLGLALLLLGLFLLTGIVGVGFDLK